MDTHPTTSDELDQQPDDTALLDLVGADLRVPLVTGGEARYVNLDNAASTSASTGVAAHVTAVLPSYASVHRGNGWTSRLSTEFYEGARREIAAFLGAREDDVLVFTRNTTDAVNLLAGAVPGRTVTLATEHHANLLPWRRVRTDNLEVRPEPTIAATLVRLEEVLRQHRPALLTVTGASNVTGELLPIADLASIAHEAGARLAVDAAQLVPHRRVDLTASGVDYLAFSGHKTYAPFGAGVLVGRRDWLDAAEPYLAGGGATRQVTSSDATWRRAPARHEAGSPNVIGAIALARAIRELGALDEAAWHAHEAGLREELLRGLSGIRGVRVLRLFSDSVDAVGVVTFTVDGVDASLVSAYLAAEHGIGVRDGRFCAHPLFDHLGVDEYAIRASVGAGSRPSDVGRLVDALQLLVTEGPRWQYEQDRGGFHPVNDPRPLPGRDEF